MRGAEACDSVTLSHDLFILVGRIVLLMFELLFLFKHLQLLLLLCFGLDWLQVEELLPRSHSQRLFRSESWLW